MMTTCRECRHAVSDEALSCPNCGAPYPARPTWNGFGYEYKSKLSVGTWPLLHVSFKYKPNRVPVPARGIIAIGQFGVGVITVAQFGVGVFSLCQFTIAGFALAQMAIAYDLLAQMGIYLHGGHGQMVRSLWDLLP